MSEQLVSFSNVDQASLDLERLLLFRKITEIRFFMLGPEGTNIGQAAQAWAKKCSIEKKSKFFYCATPEHSVSLARNVKKDGVFPVFVTCAVYNKLAELFFTNVDCNVLLHHFYMKLDAMQLASKEVTNTVSPDWLIASHASPQHLVRGLENKVVIATSNAAAAEMCASGQVQACITTEAARRLHNLKEVHSFGSPVMLFLFGTTPHGMQVLETAKKAQPEANRIPPRVPSWKEGIQSKPVSRMNRPVRKTSSRFEKPKGWCG